MYQSHIDVVVRLLNQISDSKHLMVTNKPSAGIGQDWESSGIYNKFQQRGISGIPRNSMSVQVNSLDMQLHQVVISLEVLAKQTDACQFLKDDIVFLEVLALKDD